MCSVSAVSDYYMNTYPNRINPNPYQGLGNPIPGLSPSVVHTFDAETKDMMRQALALLDKIDKRLGDIECMDDAKKAFFKDLDINLAQVGG